MSLARSRVFDHAARKYPKEKEKESILSSTGLYRDMNEIGERWENEKRSPLKMEDKKNESRAYVLGWLGCTRMAENEPQIFSPGIIDKKKKSHRCSPFIMKEEGDCCVPGTDPDHIMFLIEIQLCCALGTC